MIAKKSRKSTDFRGRIVVAYHMHYMNMINARNYSSEAIRVKLTGYDILGATLHAPFDGHTVSALKLWLLYRGINDSSSWKKPRLVTGHLKDIHFLL